MKRTIWTKVDVNNFMRMGGDIHSSYVISTEIEPVEIKKVKGIEFFSWFTPNHNRRLSEGVTGGIIADSFEDMESAIKGCPKSFLIEQIDLIKSDLIDCKKISNADFFKLYRY